MKEIARVPCAGCTACCRSELIVLFPEDGDDPAIYDCEIIEAGGQLRHALLRRADGACVYLGAQGCTIHDRAPVMCRSFDCRRFFLNFDSRRRKEMAREDPDAKAIFAAGRARLHTLRVDR